jgi:hypothetical protein
MTQKTGSKIHSRAPQERFSLMLACIYGNGGNYHSACYSFRINYLTTLFQMSTSNDACFPHVSPSVDWFLCPRRTGVSVECAYDYIVESMRRSSVRFCSHP